MTGRLSRSDVLTAIGVTVMSLVAFALLLGVAGRSPWSEQAGPVQAGVPNVARSLSLRPMPGTIVQSGPTTRIGDPASTSVGADDDARAARAATMFVEHAFLLSPVSRRDWVRAMADPSAVQPVSRFLTVWIRQANGGHDVISGPDRSVVVRTIGHRTLRSNGPETHGTISVILWQQVSQPQSSRSSGAGSGYVLTYVTLTRAGDDLTVSSMDGVVPGPAPAPGLDVIYPPLDG